jgi:hypothetical protein
LVVTRTLARERKQWLSFLLSIQPMVFSLNPPKITPNPRAHEIAVTFQSRSLYQQFRDLIRRFTFDQIEDEPDWNNLVVMHAWGSARDAGIYSTDS